MAASEELIEIKAKIAAVEQPSDEELRELLALIPGWSAESDDDTELEWSGTLLIREIEVGSEASAILLDDDSVEMNNLLDFVHELSDQDLMLDMGLDVPNQRVKNLKFSLEGELTADAVRYAAEIETYLQENQLV